MLHRITASASTFPLGLCALVCLKVLVSGGSQAVALPRGEAGPTPGFLLIQNGPPSAEQQAHEDRQALFAELEEVLRGTRVKLEELTEATARVAADTKRRKEMHALENENERMAAELVEARARQTNLEASREVAEARVAELTKSLDAAHRESSRLDQALVTLRGQNEGLGGRLTRADAARLAALDQVKQTQAEMASKLTAAADEVEQAKAELVSRRAELEIEHQKLAEANGAREQVEARVIAMEERVKRSDAAAERLRKGLADAKAQLAQAAAATVGSERAREAAGHEADRLRSEAEQARKELVAARTESVRLQIANAEVERQRDSLQKELSSATDMARQNLSVMREKIEELKAALDLAQPEQAEPAESPQAKPDAVGDEPDVTLAQAPSAMAPLPAPKPAQTTKPASVSPTAGKFEHASVRPANLEMEKLIDSLIAASATGATRSDPIMTEGPMPQVNAALAVPPSEEVAPTRGPKAEPESVQERRDATASQAPSKTTQPPAVKIHADHSTASATEPSMAGPTESPLAESGIDLFNANLQLLNELELNAGGSDLFSGVESAKGSEVRVGTTAAWDKLPSVGQDAYVKTLLNYWVSARGGKGPAVVRLVNARGQVLVEKSWQ
jgi:myosin heavy subunit